MITSVAMFIIVSATRIMASITILFTSRGGVSKDKNIGFNGYIDTWISRIYRIYRGYIEDISITIFTKDIDN